MRVSCLQGLLATAECLAPEPLCDAGAVPPLYIELLHDSEAPVVSIPAAVTPDFTLPISLEQKYRHRKGADIIDRLINSSFEVRLCNSQTKVVVATAAVDLLPFGLGSNEMCDPALPLVPTATEEAVKVGAYAYASWVTWFEARAQRVAQNHRAAIER